MPGGLGREPQDERGGDREVAGRDHPDAVLAGQGIDRVVLLGAEPARADDDADAPLERRPHVRVDRRGVRVVDEDVGGDGVERVRDRGEVRRVCPRDACDELEVVGGANRVGDRGHRSSR